MEENRNVILSARNVHVQFNLRGKRLHALRGIDLDIYKGEVLAIVGESGSGKSVFTKTFMGLLDANGSVTEGTIDYFGRDDGQPVRLSALKKEKDFARSLGKLVEIRTYRPIEKQKEFCGVLTAYDGNSVTINEDGQNRVFDRKEIALIRLAIQF